MRVYIPNLRDVGGVTTDDGRTVAPGRVLRSAMPIARDRVPDGFDWPPSLVLDLRSAGEYDSVHPLARMGSRIVNLPLLAALRPGALHYRDLHELYMILLDHASMYLVELVREVSAARGSTLIHCAAGKDRTGVSVALLLRLLGVQRELVVADYLATEAASQEIDARLRRLPGARRRPAPSPVFLAVSVDAIEAVLDVWDGHEGGVQGWFRSAGGDDALIERLRQALTS